MAFIAAIVGAVVSAVGSAIAVTSAVFGALGLGAAATALATVSVIAAGAGLVLGLNALYKALRGSTDPPAARGSITQVTLDPGAPLPYGMGEGPLGGTLIYDLGYGEMIADVPDPLRWMPILYSTGGPIESLTPYVDGNVIDTGYYGGFLATDQQLGACPEATALEPPFEPGGAAFWASDYKMSGEAAIGWNFKFDRDGKVYASGLPKLTGYGKWVKVYDPRLDSTRAGGSGSHRIANEATWAWSENPALHAGTYAYGRHQNGMRVFGCGLPDDAIDWAAVAAWANVCDANDWRLYGMITEPGDRWVNMKDICAAGGAVPVPTGGGLSFFWQAPRVSLETITEADLAGDDISVTSGRSYRDRINTVIPKYRSPDHDWELVDADPVSEATYVTEDGEEKAVNWPFNFVKDVDQAAQLARYVIGDSREFQPIELVCNIQFRGLAPGDAVDLYLPSLGLDQQAVILRREVDWANLKVKFVLIGETPAKHSWALTATGGAPPAPALGQTGAERDEITWGAQRIAAEPNADVTASHQIVIGIEQNNPINADYTGTVLSLQLPRNVEPTVTKGGSDIRLLDTTTYALSNVSASLTGISVDNTNGSSTKGRIALTAMTGTGSAVLTVTVAGVDQPPIQINFPKVNAAPPSSGGSAGTISGEGFAINSTGYLEVGRVTGLVKGSGQTISGFLTTGYSGGYDGNTMQVHVKWQVSPAGANTWTDMGTSEGGSDAVLNFDSYSGSLTFVAGSVTANKTATPSNGTYDVRLVAAATSVWTDGFYYYGANFSSFAASVTVS